MKKLEYHKNIKEENWRKKLTTYLKRYITNVILNKNICLSVFRAWPHSGIYDLREFMHLSFSNVFHFYIDLNKQKFKIKFMERIFLVTNFILMFAEKAIKICSVTTELIWNFLCASNVILWYCIILRFQKCLTKLNRTSSVLFHQVWDQKMRVYL